jgi:alkylated DNA nucleotide flippase Atl1
VINAQGRLSLERSASGAGITQRLRLVREGVVVDAAGRVSLEKFGWRIRASKPRLR